mgnify:CR=1 FL=1
MFKAINSHSSDPDTIDACSELIRQIENQNLDQLTPIAGLLFSCSAHKLDLLLAQINKSYPDIQLLGCTTDGEMTSFGGFVEGSLSLTLFYSDEIGISVGVGHQTSQDPLTSARQAVDSARTGLNAEPILAITLPDGLTAHTYPMLIEMQEILGENVPILGGTSADEVLSAKQEYHTYQFVNNELLTDSVPVMLFSGPLLFSIGVQSGWSPLGMNKVVTRQNECKVYELDGEPPLNLYQHYLGKVITDNRAMLGNFPLAVYDEHDPDQFYLRVASNADSETGVMSFMAEVPEGSHVQLTQSIRNQVIQGVSKSVNDAMNFYPGVSPSAALTFSCSGRKMALGSKTYQEIQLVMDALPDQTTISGFYTFGEIAPLTVPGQSYYHNATFVTLLLGTA